MLETPFPGVSWIQTVPWIGCVHNSQSAALTSRTGNRFHDFFSEKLRVTICNSHFSRDSPKYYNFPTHGTIFMKITVCTICFGFNLISMAISKLVYGFRGRRTLHGCLHLQPEGKWPLHGLFARPNTLKKGAFISIRASQVATFSPPNSVFVQENFFLFLKR